MDTAPPRPEQPASFGALLWRYRLAAGLSQEALAERAGLSVQGLGALENGRRQAPYRHTVGLLAEALGLDAAQRVALEGAVVRRGGPPPAVPQTPPPPATARPVPHNLPAPTTALIGREREVAGAVALLRRPGARLLTLTGAGGVGKTRLAIEIARALLEDAAVCADGTWLVELAALADPALVAQTVAATVGLRETPGLPPLDRLRAHLADKGLLLVLDNCEHLIEACASLAAALLRSCPGLRLLTTSREGLALPEETLRRVPSLAFPDPRHLPPVAEVRAYPAVALFLQRAQARREDVALSAHNAAAVAQVCARLDGIPLALELAAARLSALPVEEVAARLDDCFRLLSGGARAAVPRQRTLRATLDWSYELLTLPEQVLLQRLAVFAGGWTLEAAEAVCADEAEEAHDVPASLVAPTPATAVAQGGAGGLQAEAASRQAAMPDHPLRKDDVLDLLAGLVDKSLVVLEAARSGEATPWPAGRYRLPETVRQYGQEKLAAAGETAQVRDRHLAWCLALAEDGEAGIKGPQEVACMRLLELEHDNLRAALAWSTLTGPSTPAGAGAALGRRLAGNLWWFWSAHQHLREGVRWSEAALAGDGADSRARARALIGLGFLTMMCGNIRGAQGHFAQSLALSRAAGDMGGCAQALYRLAMVDEWLGNGAQARELFEESLALFREQEDAWNTAWALRKLAQNVCGHDRGRATDLLEESLRVARSVGAPSGIAWSLYLLGNVALARGDLGRAEPLLTESLSLARAPGDKLALGEVLQGVGLLARRQGDAGSAHVHFEELLTMGRATGNTLHRSRALFLLGCLAIEGGDADRAIALSTAGLALARRWRQGEHRGHIADQLKVLGIATMAAGLPTRAVQLLGTYAAIDATRDPVHDTWPPAPQHYEDALAAARGALGDDAFVAAWEQGKALTVEEALTLALSAGWATEVPVGSVASMDPAPA